MDKEAKDVIGFFWNGQYFSDAYTKIYEAGDWMYCENEGKLILKVRIENIELIRYNHNDNEFNL